MCDDEEKSDWRTEAAGVIHDIKVHVKNIHISEQMVSDETQIYLNLVTLEDARFCIRLDNTGFKVAGKDFDNQELEMMEQDTFETPYSLLSSISKKFTESFGNRLISELNKLKQ